MSLIYEPSGRAREYSPLAANFYNGCDHGCIYCYGPGCRRTTLENYTQNVQVKKNLEHEILRDSAKYANCRKQVLLNFIGDPYCKTDEKARVTRFALQEFFKNKIPIAILSKGGNRILFDLDLFRKFGEHIKIGQTIGLDSTEDSQKWEPGASVPEERLEVFKVLKSKGIKTWASFEPVIDTKQAIMVLKKSIPYVDEYKIGKINGRYDSGQDWTAFLAEVVDILRNEKKPFYIKYDLRIEAPTVKLFGNEVLPDEHCIKPFPEDIQIELF